MKKIKLLCNVVLSAIMPSVYAATQAERIAELERIALYEEEDDIDNNENEIIPTPADARRKFNLTDAQLFEDIKTLANKYNISETNVENRMCRSVAVGWVGSYGTTNELSYLRAIMNNPNDYAQQSAMRTVLEMTKETDLFFPIVNDIVTNKTVFSKGLRGLTYVTLADMCNAANTNTFVNNVQIRSNIAAFFLDRATCEVDSPLYVDEVACRLNPSYRHSQQRRDNLARLRKPGLTGLPAQIYDAAQRDALPKEGE